MRSLRTTRFDRVLAAGLCAAFLTLPAVAQDRTGATPNQKQRAQESTQPQRTQQQGAQQQRTQQQREQQQREQKQRAQQQRTQQQREQQARQKQQDPQASERARLAREEELKRQRATAAREKQQAQAATERAAQARAQGQAAEQANRAQAAREREQVQRDERAAGAREVQAERTAGARRQAAGRGAAAGAGESDLSPIARAIYAREREHRSRMARIGRLEEIYRKNGNQDKLRQVEQLGAREKNAYGQAMAAYRERIGEQDFERVTRSMRARSGGAGSGPAGELRGTERARQVGGQAGAGARGAGRPAAQPARGAGRPAAQPAGGAGGAPQGQRQGGAVPARDKEAPAPPRQSPPKKRGDG